MQILFTAAVMKTRAFIIHLERADQRRPQALELAARLPMPAEILPAVDGKQMSAADLLAATAPALHEPAYPFPLRPTEIACFLSHRRAWQAILDDGCDAGLIAEDDVADADPRFTAVIEAVAATIAADEFIRFPLHDRGEGGVVARQHAGTTLLEPWMPGLGMQMQLVGHEAARRLLDATRQFDRPVDSLVQMQWLHGVRVLSARPIVIREVDFLLGGSVIQNKRMGIVAKLAREVQRPLHRFAIRSANDQWRRKAA
jgi:GR25 family glycosyltransferase involved in LPS biosynthesis